MTKEQAISELQDVNRQVSFEFASEILTALGLTPADYITKDGETGISLKKVVEKIQVTELIGNLTAIKTSIGK